MQSPQSKLCQYPNVVEKLAIVGNKGQDSKSGSNQSNTIKTTQELRRANSTGSLIWSTFVFGLNVYSLFAVILWFSVDGLPDGALLFFEIMVEFLLLAEIAMRIAFRVISQRLFKKIPLFHCNPDDGFILLLIILIASVPQHTLYSYLGNFNLININDSLWSYLLAFKLLRSFEIMRYFEKLQEILFYKKTRALILMKLLENTGIIVFITHGACCAWLFIQKTNNVYYTPYPWSTNPENPFATREPYFYRAGIENDSNFIKYVDSLVWCTSTLIGSSYGDVNPRTFNEILISLVIMVLGAGVLGKIFADFTTLGYLLMVAKITENNKFEQALKFCKVNNIKQEIRDKITQYYTLKDEIGLPVKNFLVTKNLPLSLQAEINLHLNQPLLTKVNLFNFSSPDFIIAISKFMSPTLCMAGDKICTTGEIAEEMYFIQQGEVEILANDHKTILAYLREGGFFGEIGLLLTTKRTVDAKAHTLCILQTLKKSEFDKIATQFPSEYNYLKKVAKQRYKICSPEDLQRNRKSIKEFKATNLRMNAMRIGRMLSLLKNTIDEDRIMRRATTFGDKRFLKQQSTFGEAEIATTEPDGDIQPKKWYEKFFPSVILPNTKLYNYWAIIITLAVAYNYFYVPYALSFSYEAQEGDLIFLDLPTLLIYFLDIIVHSRTALIKDEAIISDIQVIRQEYFLNEFIIDLLAFIPFDYIIYNTNLGNGYASITRVLRLIKIKRAIKMSKVATSGMIASNKMFPLAILFIYFNHWMTCIMYGLIKTTPYDPNGSNFYTEFDKGQLPGTQSLYYEDHYIKYIELLYWAFQTSTAGAAEDIKAVMPQEKIFQSLCLIANKMFISFLTAEIVNLVNSVKVAYSADLDKTETYDKWMENMKLNEEIKGRVRKFHQLKWLKFKGLDENQILADLPKTLSHEITEFILRDMVENLELFRGVDSGFVGSFIKRLKFQILTDGEYVFRNGDIAEEIYFIVEGCVAVLELDEIKVIATLKKNDMFGEMGVIQMKAGIRSRSIRAIVNTTLAVMNLSDLKNICGEFPLVLKKIQQKIEDRVKQNAQIKKAEEEKKKQEEEQKKREEERGKIQEEDPDLSDVTDQSPPDSPTLPKKKVKDPLNMNKIIKKVGDNESQIVENDEENHKEDEQQPLSQDRNRNMITNEQNIASIKDADTSHDQLIKEDAPVIPEFPFKDPTKRVSMARSSMTVDTFKVTPGTSVTHHKENKHSNNTDKSREGEGKKLQRTQTRIPQLADLGKIMGMLGSQKAYMHFNTFFKRFRGALLNIVVLHNYIVMPLYLGLETITFQGFILAMEIVSMIVYALDGLTALVDRYSESKNIKKQENQNEDLKMFGFLTDKKDKPISKFYILTFFKNMMLVIPFALIFERNDVQGRFTNPYLLILQLLRLISVGYLFWIFELRFFRKRPGLANIFSAIYCFIILNHFFGCIMMIIGNTADSYIDSWKVKLPAPRLDWPNIDESFRVTDDKTIYISAIYYSYLVTSHIGGGDVGPVSIPEKIYCNVMMYISTFVFAFIFGNLVSLVDDIIPKYQKNFDKNYKRVLEFVKRNNFQLYIEKVHKYFDYIWETNKGYEERELLDELPPILRIDVQMARYKTSIKKSKFFVDENNSLNESIASYFFKKCKYLVAVTDDIILNAGQETQEVYLILDGEVEAYAKESQKLRRFGPGQYFGGYIPKIPEIFEFKATHITKLAVLDSASFSFLCEAYPKWIEHVRRQNSVYKAIIDFQKRVREWLQEKRTKEDTKLFKKETLNLSDRKSINQSTTQKSIIICYHLNLKANFFMRIGLSKHLRTRIMVMQRFRWFIKPDSKFRMLSETIHFCLILYSAFAVPVIVGFNMSLSVFQLTMEILVLIEGILYSICQLRLAYHEAGFLMIDFKNILKNYWNRGMIFEIIGQIPLILIFTLTQIGEFSIIISLLKLNRICLIMRINMTLNLFGTLHPKLMKWTALFKPIFLLSFIWHTSSMMWMWFNLMVNSLELVNWKIEQQNDVGRFWLEFLEMTNFQYIQQYVFCLHWAMNIASTYGDVENLDYNDWEKIAVILMSYVGNGLLALAFGMLAEYSEALPEKFSQIFQTVNKLEGVIDKKTAGKLKLKLELFYAYEIEKKGGTFKNVSELEDMIPATLLRDFVYERSKIFNNHPVFALITSKICLVELASAMEANLYLPGDYLVQKEDFGHEMHFIESGIMNCYSMNERQIILRIRGGDFMGEKALINLTKRIYPIAAETFCQVLSLSKRSFDTILAKFPQIESLVIEKLNRRIDEMELNEEILIKLSNQLHLNNDDPSEMEFIENKELLQRILLSMEVMVQKNEAPPVIEVEENSDDKPAPKAFDLKKIKLIVDQDSDISSVSSDEENRIEDEYVEEDELGDALANTNKISLRTPEQEKQRRLSRIVLGSEKSISKDNGYKVKWGVNLT